MMRLRAIAIIFIFFFGSSISSVFAQANKPKAPLTRILFVFDASRSMAGKWEKDTKIKIAKRLLSEMVDSLQQLDNVEIALRVYGHQSSVEPYQDCNDTKLEVPFGLNTAPLIKRKLQYIKPKGTTPIAHSLEVSANDFPSCPTCRNILILITDGIEACDGDPCAVSLALQKSGIVLKPFVIGIGLDPGLKKTFDCVGTFYDAATENKFKEVFNVVISQALNSTSAQVNLLDLYGQPTETNVNMTFYDMVSGRMLYNYVHTMNYRGVPDTILLDPLVQYQMVVHTIPNVMVDSISLSPGKHTIIAADAPQGSINLKSSSNLQRDLTFSVMLPDSCKILNTQYANQPENYLVGSYDVIVNTIPEIILKDVKVDQSSTTTIEVPRPGLATFLSSSTGYGSLYVVENNQMKWLMNLDKDKTRQTVTLQPGNYQAVFRAKNAKQSLFTVSKAFKIVSGSSEQVQLY